MSRVFQALPVQLIRRPSVVSGCVTSVIRSTAGGVSPSHESLSQSGNTVKYTPNGTFTGTDTLGFGVAPVVGVVP
jgi:hypothetical protein